MWLAAPRQTGYQAWESIPIYKIRFKNSPSPVSFRQQRDGSSEAGVQLDVYFLDTFNLFSSTGGGKF